MLEEFRWRIRLYPIDAVVVHQADEETTSDIFLRLQEGIPLNSAEKLNAMKGIFRNSVVRLSKHDFLSKIGIPNYRFAHRYICAQIALLELQNISLPSGGMNITSVNFRNLRETYRLYNSVQPPAHVFNQMERTLNFLIETLGESTSRTIKFRRDLIPIYLLASHILRKYSLVGGEDKFKEFVEQFLTKIYSYTDSTSEEDKPYYDYLDARSYAMNSKDSIKKGFEKILGKFLEFVSDLQLKDPQRFFDYGQKLAIFFRDKYQCKLCGKSITFDEADFHHKKSWSEGGPTTVENGLLVCRNCPH